MEQQYHGGNFAAWATTVTRNHILGIREVRRPEQAAAPAPPYIVAALADTDRSHASAEDITLQNQALSRINAVFETVGVRPIARKAMIMLYVHKITAREIADELGVAVGTVLSMTERAKQSIRMHYGITKDTQLWDIFGSSDRPEQKAA